MAALDSGFPRCLCVAMKKSLIPEAQLTAGTLETRGRDAVRSSQSSAKTQKETMNNFCNGLAVHCAPFVPWGSSAGLIRNTN